MTYLRCVFARSAVHLSRGQDQDPQKEQGGRGRGCALLARDALLTRRGEAGWPASATRYPAVFGADPAVR